MKVVVVASGKGGTGKTTLVTHLAVTTAANTVIIGTDRQGSVERWWNRRESEKPAYAQVDPERLRAALAELDAQGYNLAVVDTPPARPAPSVLAVADLVLIPARPSPLDLEAVSEMAQALNGLRFAYVLNATPARSRLANEAIEILKPLAGVVGQRAIFAEAMINGRTAGELDPESRAAKEIATLWQYCRKELQR
jgi:chromosome partitioning protein